MPRPIRSAQTRLTITWAKYGFSGAVIQPASASRGSASGSSDTGAEPKRGRGGRTLPVSGCLTEPDFAVKTISSLPEIGGERPVPLRPTRAK